MLSGTAAVVAAAGCSDSMIYLCKFYFLRDGNDNEKIEVIRRVYL
jgi:hypothetical protein